MNPDRTQPKKKKKPFLKREVGEGKKNQCLLNIVTPPLPNPDPAGAAGRRCRRSEGLRIMYLPSDRAPATASPHPQPSTSAAAPLAGSSSRKPAASTQIVLNYRYVAS